MPAELLFDRQVSQPRIVLEELGVSRVVVGEVECTGLGRNERVARDCDVGCAVEANGAIVCAPPTRVEG